MCEGKFRVMLGRVLLPKQAYPKVPIVRYKNVTMAMPMKRTV